jgi:hypothetical protein
MSLCDDWGNVPVFIPQADFIGYKSTDPSGCFRRSREQLNKAGYDLVSPGWATQNIGAGIYQIYLASDVGKMKSGYQQAQFEAGVKYLKTAISVKIPVMVGVELYAGSSSGDKVTDHYLTIVGMGSDDTGKFFYYYDNATSWATIGASDKNRLYCDCENFSLIGGGDDGNRYLNPEVNKVITYRKYTVTQIRESKKMPKKK